MTQIQDEKMKDTKNIENKGNEKVVELKKVDKELAGSEKKQVETQPVQENRAFEQKKTASH